MRISCAVGRHRAGSRLVRNQGFEFGRCRACGRDLVRSRGSWRTVPGGFRVVWRRGPPGAGAAPSAAQFLLDLPASGRSLVAAGAVRGRGRGRIAAAADFVVLGAHCLAWAIADRFRAWIESLRAPRVARRPVLSLTAG